jgi:hypothetical protein
MTLALTQPPKALRKELFRFGCGRGGRGGGCQSGQKNNPLKTMPPAPLPVAGMWHKVHDVGNTSMDYMQHVALVFF